MSEELKDPVNVGDSEQVERIRQEITKPPEEMAGTLGAANVDDAAGQDASAVSNVDEEDPARAEMFANVHTAGSLYEAAVSKILKNS